MVVGVWKDPVWSKVIATGIIAVITAVGAYFFELWPIISIYSEKVWLGIIASSNIPNWVLFSLSSLSILFVYGLFTKIYENNTEHPTFKSYNQDTLTGILFCWSYQGAKIVGLHSLCPKCQYEIIPKDEPNYQTGAFCHRFKCADCGYDAGVYDYKELNERVQLKIQKTIRTGEWKTKIKA